MDYSTWLSSSSLDVSLGCGGGGGDGDNTLRLLDDSPVRDCFSKVHVATNSSEIGSNPLLKHEVGTLMEELNRVNGQNKKLTETLTLVREEYNDLKRKLMNYVGKSYSDEIVDNATTNNKRRKMENYYVANHCNNDDINNNNNDTKIVKNNSGESSSSDEEDSCQKPPKSETLKAKITRVAVRTQASDSTLILKDGYLWRKYGQKVTRDNPCPRAYFKCSFAPSCPVKKKVQRSQEDQSMLVATYEGEHNHAPPPNQETSPNSSRGFTLSSSPYNDDDNNNTTLGSSCPNRSLDQTKSKASQNVAYDTTKSSSSNVSTITTLPSNNVTKFNSPEFQKLLAEQMASSLTKDPNFTAALAAAISGRISRQ